MRQTNSAVTMLVKAYKAVLSHCFINKNPRGGVKQSLIKSLLAFSSLLYFSSSVSAAVYFNPDNASLDDNRNLTISGSISSSDSFYSLDNNENETLASIKSDGEISPVIDWNVHAFTIDNSSLTVKGNTTISSHSTQRLGDENTDGTYIFTVTNSGLLNLQGNVDIVAKHDKQVESIGNNVFYARDEGSKIIIGSEGTTTRAWSIADKPDVISAKEGASVEIKSTDNQLVGSVDMIDFPDNFDINRDGLNNILSQISLSDMEGYFDGSISFSEIFNKYVTDAGDLVSGEFKKDTVNGTFSGQNSFWFGDDQSWMNSKINSTATIDATVSVLGRTPDILENINISSLIKDYVTSQIEDDFNLVFENGAQWTYFGITDEYNREYPEDIDTSISIIGPITADIDGTVTAYINVSAIPKRISQITLRNGGIINLYDENIQQTWKDLGLLDAFPELADVNHDYVRIGNLKGTDGIFRLDLNAGDKSQSDMVFVESSDDHGKFYIEPYNPEYLTAITPDNTLRFATVSKDSGVTFADSENIYGNTLYDYELVIDSEEYAKNDPENSIYEDKVAADGESLDFDDGDINWFIKRVIVRDSAASLAMTGAGHATYDAITQLERYDSKNTDVSRYAGEKEVVWVRVKHGQKKRKNQYSGDYTKATVGFDHYITSSNRIGAGFTYLSGDADFDDVNGSGDLTGYEGMIYDTQYFDNQYLDFVFRFGDVKNEFDAVNAVGALPISADYHQKYAALSAEYGFRYTDARGVFFEPQAQFQLAYLDDADYDTQRNMSTDIDSAVSAIGRIGIRIGKSWELDNGYTNDLYIRSDVMHQFTDGQDALYTDGTNRVDVTWGDKNTWYDLGFGGIVHLGDNFSMALDVSKSVGDDVTDTWAINGQARVIF